MDRPNNVSHDNNGSSQRKLHVRVSEGSGTTMILIHGFTGSSLNWNKLSRSLKPDYKCVALDFIGHARSPAPMEPEAYQTKAILQDIDELVDTHSNGQAILCGLSMGAAAALLYTLNYPHKVKALILTSFPAGSDSPNSLSAVATPFANAILEKGLEEAGEQFVWGENGLFSKSDAAMIKHGFLQHPHPHGLALCMREFLAEIPSRESLLEAVASIKAPTLIIAGERDFPCLEYSKALSKALPEKLQQLIIIENGGHLVNIDSEKRYNEVVTVFLSQLNT